MKPSHTASVSALLPAWVGRPVGASSAVTTSHGSAQSPQGLWAASRSNGSQPQLQTGFTWKFKKIPRSKNTESQVHPHIPGHSVGGHQNCKELPCGGPVQLVARNSCAKGSEHRALPPPSRAPTHGVRRGTSAHAVCLSTNMHVPAREHACACMGTHTCTHRRTHTRTCTGTHAYTHAFLEQKGAGQGDSEHKHESFARRFLCFVWPPRPPLPFFSWCLVEGNVLWIQIP